MECQVADTVPRERVRETTVHSLSFPASLPNTCPSVGCDHVGQNSADQSLLLGDEWPPPNAFEAADAFISKSEPIISFLEKMDYLLSLRLLFQPLEILGTDNTGGQSQHKDYRLDRMASSRKARAS